MCLMQHKGEVFESELEELQKDTQAVASKTQLRTKAGALQKGWLMFGSSSAASGPDPRAVFAVRKARMTASRIDLRRR